VNQPQGPPNLSYGNTANSNPQSDAGGIGGGMGMGAATNFDGGMANGRQSGMAGGGSGYGIQNNFGVVPPFGSPEFTAPGEAKQSGSKEQNQNRQSRGELTQTNDQIVPPSAWQTTDGSSSTREIGNNFSPAVADLQETEQAYTASLTITLPVRGKEFFFTTPRGDVVLSANGISKTVTRRMIGLLMLVLALALVAATKRRRRISSR
ncbi:MAG TPA: hypothetical protein VM260_03420, partial [Pirellula sp.]|nr:hypothetical protein [Pirellula sp.]